ncbi:MAG: amidase [Anaerolineales bacterium]|nr:amidase [Anaerolineales bacterium]
MNFVGSTVTYLSEKIDQLERRFAAREADVLAFVPEPGRFERLRRDAAVLEARWPNPPARPPLFGLLVGVKDIFRVDGFPTHAGSQVPPEALAGAEALSVTRLKQAGALIVGKTVTTEFAYFGPGPTRNPLNLAHTPGGSSSGSAAAIAAGLAEVTLGTQTIGSIVRPASFCGVVGFKPSYERVSRAGVIPLSPSLDHVGPLATTVAEVARAAAVLIADWRADVGVGAPVIGVPGGLYLQRADAEMRLHFAQVIDRLEVAGFEVRRVAAFDDFDALAARNQAIVAGDAARVHAIWYGQYGARYHARTQDLVTRGRAIGDAELETLRGSRPALRESLTSLMNDHGLDLWASPSAVGAAPAGLDSTGDPVMNMPWTHAGLPAINLPSGIAANGLPLGLQLVARFGQDEELLAWAAGPLGAAVSR